MHYYNTSICTNKQLIATKQCMKYYIYLGAWTSKQNKLIKLN